MILLYIFQVQKNYVRAVHPAGATGTRDSSCRRRFERRATAKSLRFWFYFSRHSGISRSRAHQGYQMAKFDPFLTLDCARVEGAGVQSKERKASNIAEQRSGAIVQKPGRPNTYDSKNSAIAIWQPWRTWHVGNLSLPFEVFSLSKDSRHKLTRGPRSVSAFQLRVHLSSGFFSVKIEGGVDRLHITKPPCNSTTTKTFRSFLLRLLRRVLDYRQC